MRYALLALVCLACSDSTEPESRVVLEGTYTLALEGCFSCDLNAVPGIIATFGDGTPVLLTLQVGAGTEESIPVTVTGLSTGIDRIAPQAFDMEWREDISTSIGSAYWEPVDYGSGRMTLFLKRDGGAFECAFGMLYPGVDFGPPMTCAVQ